MSLLRDSQATPGSPARFIAANLVGAIDLVTLDRDGTKWDKGQTDRSNGTTYWTACMNVTMAQLLPNAEILRRFGYDPSD